MPAPAVTLKLRKFRRRFGIAAPRVIVRSHVPWHWHAAAVALLVAVVATGVWALAQQGEAAQLKEDVGVLRSVLLAREEELRHLRGLAGTEQSAAQVDRTTNRKLADRMKALEAENAALKEDVALFERLVPADGEESAVRVERMQVNAEREPGRYRYRLMLGFAPNKQAKEFKGRLQLHVTFSQEGRRQELVLPGDKDASPDFQLEIRHLLRKEGVLIIPSGARLNSVEARLFQGDTLKAKHLAQL